eukprot:3299380-Prymnesium_polylepis.1
MSTSVAVLGEDGNSDGARGAGPGDCGSNASARAGSGGWRADDASWAADEIIQRAVWARQQMRVPFYIYDSDSDSGFSLERELSALRPCVTRTDHPHVGDFWFIEALATHRWRTRSAHEASLIVLPVFLGIEAADLCKYRSTATLDAIRNTSTWRLRERDHVLLATNWRVSVGPMPYKGVLLPSRQLVWAHYEAYSASFDRSRTRNSWEASIIKDRQRAGAMVAA